MGLPLRRATRQRVAIPWPAGTGIDVDARSVTAIRVRPPRLRAFARVTARRTATGGDYDFGMRTPFGPDWDDLSLEHVQAFLDEPRNEGLTWESKGDDIRAEHVREAVCAFGNSILGGFLILGAKQDTTTKVWSVNGWVPRDEAEI